MLTSLESMGIHMNISTILVRLPQIDDCLANFLFPIGIFSERDLPEYRSRNFEERGFTVGIGGYVPSHPNLPVPLLLNDHSRPVGSGKTALTLALCRLLRTEYNIGIISWCLTSIYD